MMRLRTVLPERHGRRCNYYRPVEGRTGQMIMQTIEQATVTIDGIELIFGATYSDGKEIDGFTLKEPDEYHGGKDCIMLVHRYGRMFLIGPSGTIHTCINRNLCWVGGEVCGWTTHPTGIYGHISDLKLVTD